MKRLYYLPFLLSFAVLSCNRGEGLVDTSLTDVFDNTYETIQFSQDGGKDTVDIPFDNCYMHFIRNNDSVLFFYLLEPDYSTLDSIIEQRSIIVEPKVVDVDPFKGFSYFEWEWFSIELKDQKAYISVKENNTQSERIAEIILPNKNRLQRLEITINQNN